MAIRYLAPGVIFTSRFNLGPARSGLAGTARVRLLNNNGTPDDPAYGPSTENLVEDPTDSGTYVFRGITPDTEGPYSPALDDGTTTNRLYFDDDIIVTTDEVLLAGAVRPGDPYTSRVNLGPTYSGLTGTVRFRLVDNDSTPDDPVYGPSPDDIIEDPTDSGSYVFTGGVAPAAKLYSRAWDKGTDRLFYDDDLLVISGPIGAAAPDGRDLCVLADVVRYVPGYESDPDTDDTLQRLITAESRTIHGETGREFVTIPGLTTRRFPITSRAAARRTIRIGDCAEISAAEVQMEDGTVTSTVDITKLDTLPLVREEWEPIEEIRFFAFTGSQVALACGRFISVTATWGFPSIPPDVREACAKRVIVRYLSDVASVGTAFADAIANSDINIGALLKSSTFALGSYMGPGFA